MKKRGILFIAALMFVSISTLATVVTTSDSVVITEFVSNHVGDDNEWVELYNASSDTVNIIGWRIVDGWPQGGIPGHAGYYVPNTVDTLLAPGEYFTILTSALGLTKTPPNPLIPSTFVPDWDACGLASGNMGLNNDGDMLHLYDSSGVQVDSVDFWDLADGGWPYGAMGGGVTYELIDPLLDNTYGHNWQASKVWGGTPGKAAITEDLGFPKIVITEVMYNDGKGDWIEITNLEADSVDLSNWHIKEDFYINFDPSLAIFPSGTKIGPGQFMTIAFHTGLDFTPDLELVGAADLSSTRDNIFLFNENDSLVTHFHYEDSGGDYQFGHCTAADGGGSSLEIIDIYGDQTDPQNWQASINVGGSPGALSFTPPILVSAEVTSPTTVNILFSEPVDSTTAVTKTNYVIDHGMGNPDSVIWSGDIVELTLGTIVWDTTYTLAVWNVKDVEAGFVIADSSTIEFGRYKPDAIPPTVLKVNAISDSTVFVIFDEEVDSTTAATPANYSIDNSVGNPVAAKWLGDQVELALAVKLTFDVTYQLTVSNVQDTMENVIETVSVPFILKDYRGKIVISEFVWNSEFYDNEWFELCNNSTDTIDILGWSFRDEPASHQLLIIPDTCDTKLAPGEFFTVYIYGEGEEKGWPLHFKPDLNRAIDYTDTTRNHIWNLNNGGGDILYMWDEAGRLVEEISYWPVETFNLQHKWGVGVTMERIDLDGPCDDPSNWMASWYYGGSPGAPNRLERPVYPKIVINEVMYNSADGNTEFVELKNLDEVAVDISGWFLRRDNPTHPIIPFTEGSVLQPGDFYVVLIDSLGGQDLGFVPDMNYTNISKINYSNTNDNVILFNDDELMVTYMHYDDGVGSYKEFTHAQDADGFGKSLEYWDYREENWEPLAWAASQDSGGTPGRENFIPDVVPPVVDSALAISDTTVRVYFNEELNYTTAVNKNNYTIDNGIGNPLYNLLETGNMTVVLYLNPTNPLVEGTNYTVTVTGVTDVSGNAIEDMNTATFVGPPAVGIDGKDALPKVFALHKNFPNPFNPVTTINYDLPKDANVRIVIYDLMGREVRTLVNRHQKAGYQTLQWNALDNRGLPVSSGFYFYVMDADKFHKTEKMLLLK